MPQTSQIYSSLLFVLNTFNNPTPISRTLSISSLFFKSLINLRQFDARFSCLAVFSANCPKIDVLSVSLNKGLVLKRVEIMCDCLNSQFKTILCNSFRCSRMCFNALIKVYWIGKASYWTRSIIDTIHSLDIVSFAEISVFVTFNAIWHNKLKWKSMFLLVGVFICNLIHLSLFSLSYSLFCMAEISPI